MRSTDAKGGVTGLTARVGGESWNYVNLVTTVFALVSTVLTGCVLGYLYSALIGTAWIATAGASLLAMIMATTRLSGGNERAVRPAITFNLITIAMWMAAAIAMFATGDSAAMVAATSMGWTWISHLLIGSQRNRVTMFMAMAIPSAALLYFLIATSWQNYPFWIAMAATGSAVLTALTLAKSAEIAHENFKRVGKATADAKAMRSKLEFAIGAAGDGYFEVDLDTMTLTPNPKFANAMGFPEGPRDATNLHRFFHADDVPAAIANLDMCRGGMSDGWNQDLRVRAASGEDRWMNLRARVLEATENSPRLLIGTVIDLSSRKRMESEIIAAKEAAEASSKAKGEFLANMSHEIRTPLNGVLGMAQALEAANLSPEDREKVAVILDSGRSLTTLLNDVLDLSKIEAGKLEIVPVPGDIVQTMARTRQLFQTQAEAKGLDLSMTMDAELHRDLSFDPVRVRQCVSNLVSNAIKFTSKGGIEIKLSSKKLDDGEHLVSIRISDTGIGMSEAAIGRLFQAFSQADNSTTRQFGGTGLGLFISRQLARMMGGDIVVESREGAGSVFTFTFRSAEAVAAPATVPAALAQTARPAGSLRGVKVLLTDDNAINRQVIRLFLAPHGCEIVEATNGQDALDKIAAHPFDLILLDVHMPVMDGKEAIQKIRAAGQPWSTLPVIALTADAMSGDRERYLQLGMTDYVSKPVDQNDLVAKMQAVLGGAPTAAQRRASA